MKNRFSSKIMVLDVGWPRRDSKIHLMSLLIGWVTRGKENFCHSFSCTYFIMFYSDKSYLFNLCKRAFCIYFVIIKNLCT